MQSNRIKLLIVTLLAVNFNQTLKCDSPLAHALRIAVINDALKQAEPTTAPATPKTIISIFITGNRLEPIVKLVEDTPDKRRGTNPTRTKLPVAKRNGARNRGAGNRY